MDSGYTPAMLRLWIAAIAVTAVGLFVGVMLLPASWVTTAQSCWRPGLA
jgi:hypothetical protein